MVPEYPGFGTPSPEKIQTQTPVLQRLRVLQGQIIIYHYDKDG